MGIIFLWWMPTRNDNRPARKKQMKVLESLLRSFLRSAKSTEQYFPALNLYIDITKFNRTLQ